MKDYKLEYTELDKGLTGISFVNKPATETKALTIDKSLINDRVVIGVLLPANSPILRKDQVRGYHSITFTPDLIQEVMLNSDLQDLIYNTEHSENLVEGVKIINSYQVDVSQGILPPKDLDVTDGSWIISLEIQDNNLWQDILKGRYTGISAECYFSYPLELDKLKSLYYTLNKLIK